MNAGLETVGKTSMVRAAVVLDFDRRRAGNLATIDREESDPRGALALSALRALALRVEQERQEPHAPLWQAFVAGKLTVIDRFEHAGRRVVLAVGEVPSTPARQRLTGREAEALAHAARGHDDKRIAYDMGLQPSTVASLLSRAARKLGAPNRMDLIRRCLAEARARRSEQPGADAHDEAPRGLRTGRVELDGQRVLVLSFPDHDSSGAAPEPTPAVAAPQLQHQPQLPQLSAAERAVALLLLAGHRRAVIAQMRGAAIGTVHKQVECVYRKLGVGSRRELAARIFTDEVRP